jgi:hypothetical protein
MAREECLPVARLSAVCSTNRQTLALLLENHRESVEELWLHGQLEIPNFDAQKALE